MTLNKIPHKPYDVYGIGNAVVDFLVFVEENILNNVLLSKGHMTLSSSEDQAKLIHYLENQSLKFQMNSGGSAANTMMAVVKAGGKAFYTGKIAKDPYGEFYRMNLLEAGVDFDVHPLDESQGSTATCIVLITPDAERTMSTHLGVSVLLKEEDLREDIIMNSSIMYIEGYLWTNEITRNTAKKAIEIAKIHQIPVGFTFSDGFVVQQFREDFLHHIKNQDFDIVFMNSDEAHFFMESPTIEKILQELKKFSNLFYVTASEKGAYVVCNDKIQLVSGFPVKPLDTTGAGDAFAGGVLFGLTHNYDIYQSAKIGNFMASEVVQIQGARLTRDYSKKIAQLFS